jgi:signal transduction histidine kinase
VLIVAVITAGALLAIYLLSENYREEEFYDRLEKRSINIARFLIDVDEIDEFLLYRIERDNPVKLNEETIRIFNFENELIFSMDEDEKMAVETELINRVRLESNVKFKEGDGEYLGVFFTSRYDRFVFISSAADVYGNRKIRNLRTILLIVFGISLLLVFLGGRVYAGQALQPIQRIIYQVGKITPADLNDRVDEGNGQDEMAQLAASFNNMLIRVEAAFKTQKHFIANASHEMRTPLTAISGQLEVLSLKERSIEEYMRLKMKL